MNRTLTFTQICDSRFNKTEDDLKLINTKLLKELNNINGLKVKVDNIRHVEFKKEHNAESEHKHDISFRQNYYTQKNTLKTTWNDIFNIINKVRAAHYSFISLREFP